MATTNGRFLLGLLVGLLFGGGITHLLSDNPTSAAEPAAALSPGAPTRGDLTPTPDHSPTSTESARSLPAALPARQVNDRELAGLVAAVKGEGTAATSGSGTISGEVFDEEGKGLAGVLLRLTESSSGGSSMTSTKVGGDAPEIDTLEETVRRTADAYNSRRATTQDTRTDANGAYTFEGLADERWNIAAYLPDHSISAKGSSRSVRIGGEVNFSAVSVSTLRATLVGPQGTSVDEAVLQVVVKGARYGSKRYKWTDEDPTLALTAGDYEVTAFAEGTGPVEDYRLASAVQDVTVVSGSNGEPLRFELSARLGIRGVLRLAKGDPVADRYYLRMMPLAPDQEVDLKLLAESGERKSAKPGAEYSFLELEAGRFVVGVARGYSGAIIHHLELEVTDRIVEADLNLPALDRSRFLRVSVQDPAGATVEGVKFNLSHDKQNGFRYGNTETVRDNDGSYLVNVDDDVADLYWGNSSEQAEFELSLTHDKYGKRSEKLAQAQTELAVTFSVPGQLTATVTGYQGSGYEGRLSVAARRLGENEMQAMMVMMGGNKSKVGPDGIQVIEALEPGMYKIVLSGTPKENSRRFSSANTLASVEIEIFPGENEVQLSIPSLYSLRVHWADGKAGASVHLTDSQSSMAFGGLAAATLDEQGFAEWENLKAGLYVIRAGSGSMEVTLPCGEVEFEAMKVNALRVVVTDSSGDLAKLGFVTDDLIIGKGGKEFKGTPSMGAILKLSQSKGESETFMVLRSGGQLEITAKSEDLRGWQDLGGQLLPASR